MSDYGPPRESSTWGSGGSVGRERGARRKKVYEYLKAANELRQSYTAQWTAQINGSRGYDEEFLNTPGAFPDVEIARAGGEEMVIFPSYARRLVRNQITESQRRRRESVSTLDEYRGVSDEQQPALPELEEFGDENAVVAVDVRGWIYAPHRGPMTRKHRLAIALARKLTGIPAPTGSTDPDGADQDAGRIPKMTERREEEIVDTEAQSIINKVQKGNELGWKEASSEGLDDDNTTPKSSLQRMPTTSSVESTQLSKDEISVANAHLLERIRPFLTSPMARMPVTVFFFNDKQSQSRNIMTNESGHFSIRASLPFVPTHVRVLASEELSAIKEIEVIEPTGVSLISDIDDTVKHSAIVSGAKEIFRNVFVRELEELTIDGVTEWYNELAKLGVEVHYVSNAPWQLYPLLERYFKLAGLPPGSFHLKQYSGMLQGIFEPTVERKKGSLEQILRDFPERKFILVGDSGEADLEVYTEIVLANPGRILGIFIRDITTRQHKKFFEKSVDFSENAPTRSHSRPGIIDHSDLLINRPALPPRPPRIHSDPAPDTKRQDTPDLIDLSDDSEKPSNSRTPPTVPSKPSSLRSVTNTGDLADKPLEMRGPIKRKPAPPLPRRSPAAESNSLLGEQAPGLKESRDNGDAIAENTAKQLPTRNRPVVSPESDQLPRQPPPPPPPRRSNTGSFSSQQNAATNRLTSQTQQTFPTASTSPTPSTQSCSSSRQTWSPAPGSKLRPAASEPSLLRSSTNSTENPSAPPPPPLPNKREELWRRRWERASEIMGDRGVVLGSWRVGKDVQDVSIWLVKEQLKNKR